MKTQIYGRFYYSNSEMEIYEGRRIDIGWKTFRIKHHQFHPESLEELASELKTNLNRIIFHEIRCPALARLSNQLEKSGLYQPYIPYRAEIVDFKGCKCLKDMMGKIFNIYILDPKRGGVVYEDIKDYLDTY